MTKDEFIIKANQVHKNKYDYSKTEYKSLSKNITIICRIHGVFEQRPEKHLQGQGCPKCNPKHRLTTEEFIKKAQNVHNDKYDYSLVHYVNSRTNIKIICRIHGVFEQRPDCHLEGKGCSKCAREQSAIRHNMAIEEFIEKAQKVHKDRYSYSKVNYVNNLTEVEIICKTHGRFCQKPASHLQGYGCQLCGGTKKLTNKQFIEKADIVHRGAYNYDMTKYINNRTPIIITCPKHGNFSQLPSSHLQGQNCPKCAREQASLKNTLTTEEFIKKAQQVHQGTYDYSSTVYQGHKKNIKIICKTHGEFTQMAYRHLQGRGCQKCSSTYKLTSEQFIEKASQIHKGIYHYNLIHYVNLTTEVEIVCEKHGIFKQKPSYHLEGCGCPKCHMSKGEIAICDWLRKRNIYYEQQKKFQNLGQLSYDFYIPRENLLIEFNGIQHYKFVEYFHQTEQELHLQKHRDWLKRKFAKTNGFDLLVIPYWDFNKIEDILNEKIFN